MLADKVEEWAKAYIAEGRQEGLKEGRQEGEILALQKQLSRKFGVISIALTEKIANATPDQIDVWLDRVVDGLPLDEIFK
jgi:flagellar biosynthesis/type III secretory pathway protein FliH